MSFLQSVTFKNKQIDMFLPGFTNLPIPLQVGGVGFEPTNRCLYSIYIAEINLNFYTLISTFSPISGTLTSYFSIALIIIAIGLKSSPPNIALQIDGENPDTNPTF